MKKPIFICALVFILSFSGCWFSKDKDPAPSDDGPTIEENNNSNEQVSDEAKQGAAYFSRKLKEAQEND